MPSQSSSVRTLTHYAVLGVTEAATKNEIAKAFRTLALSLHPDRKAGVQDNREHEACSVVVSSAEPSSTTTSTDHIFVGAHNADHPETVKSTQIVAFTEAAEAYEILSDPLKRAEYDQKLALERAEAERAKVEEEGTSAPRGDHLLRRTRPSTGVQEGSSMREHVQGAHIPADILRRPPTGSSSAAAGTRHYASSFEGDPLLPGLNSINNNISHALHRRPPTAPLGTCMSPIGFSFSGGGGGALYGSEEVRQQWDEHFLERKDGKLERRRPASTRRQQPSRPCSGIPPAVVVGGNAALSERDHHFTPSPMPMPLPRGGGGFSSSFGSGGARLSAGARRTPIPSRQASAARDGLGRAHTVISEDAHGNQRRAMQTNDGEDLSERASRRRSVDTTGSIPSEEDRPSTSLPNVRRNSVRLDNFHQAEAQEHVCPEGCSAPPLHVPSGGSNRPATGSLSKPPTPLGAARVRQLKHLREKMSSATSGSHIFNRFSSGSTPVSCSAPQQMGGGLGTKPEVSDKGGALDPRRNSNERAATPIIEGISVEGRGQDSLPPRPYKTGVEGDQSIHDCTPPANTKMQTNNVSMNRPPTSTTRVHTQSSPLDLLPELDEGVEGIKGLSFGFSASSLPQRYSSVRSSTNRPTATPMALKLDQFVSPFRRAASSSLRDRLYRTTGSTPVVLPSRQGHLQSPPSVTMSNAINTSNNNKAAFTSGGRSRLLQQSAHNVSVLHNGNRAATPTGSSGQSSAALRTLEVFFSNNTSSRVSPPSSSSSPLRSLQRGEREFRSHSALV